MSNSRIYTVQDKRASNPQNRMRLVRASSKSQAIRHVALDTLHAIVAPQESLVQLIGQGVKVEDATSDAETDAEPQA